MTRTAGIPDSFADLPLRDGDAESAVTAPASDATPWTAPEGIEVKPNALGCRIRDHRADLEALAAAWEAAVADLG